MSLEAAMRGVATGGAGHGSADLVISAVDHDGATVLQRVDERFLLGSLVPVVFLVSASLALIVYSFQTGIPPSPRVFGSTWGHGTGMWWG
jgi:hypothetical protein